SRRGPLPRPTVTTKGHRRGQHGLEDPRHRLGGARRDRRQQGHQHGLAEGRQGRLHRPEQPGQPARRGHRLRCPGRPGHGPGPDHRHPAGCGLLQEVGRPPPRGDAGRQGSGGEGLLMRVVSITEPGDADVLPASDAPAPPPGPGRVVVAPVAPGVTRADALQRRGHYPPPKGASLLPGLELSGTIREVGPEVEDWSVGDEVCALVDGGGYAEQVLVPATQLLPVPDGVSVRDAAGLPEVTCTVWSNVFMTANLQPDEVLLVHGGTSGIGTIAIQLAKAAGARVAVTAGSEEKLAFCRELGADI